jgi:hypothetical protein
MKRLLLGVMILGGAAVLGGCPIYPDRSSYQVCNQCCSDADCNYGQYCDSNGYCAANNYQYDASTPPPTSPCGYCPAGTQCTLSGGLLQCLPPAPPVTGDEDAGPGPGLDASPPGRPDAGDGGDGGADGGSLVHIACNSDAECAPAGAGSRCIDGTCAAQGELCSDGTQCVAGGESCVDGVCLPICSKMEPNCPAGYACDFNRGVCSVNPAACSGNCPGGAVCVESHCVAPCTATDAGPACAASGQVCINGGCIPDQAAHFQCLNEGYSGALASTCDSQSICLHGDCYSACGDGGICSKPGDTCHQVLFLKVPLSVCAPANNLGTACDPAIGQLCTDETKLCIDGTCK